MSSTHQICLISADTLRTLMHQVPLPKNETEMPDYQAQVKAIATKACWEANKKEWPLLEVKSLTPEQERAVYNKTACCIL